MWCQHNATGLRRVSLQLFLRKAANSVLKEGTHQELEQQMNKNLIPRLFTLYTKFCVTGLNIFSKENMSINTECRKQILKFI